MFFIKNKKNKIAEDFDETFREMLDLNALNKQLTEKRVEVRKSCSYCYCLYIHPGFQWAVPSYRMGPSAPLLAWQFEVPKWHRQMYKSASGGAPDAQKCIWR